MNLTYDNILNAFVNALPSNFILEYNNNLDTKWSEILPNAYSESIYGVMRVDSGENQYIATQTIKTENMHFTFVIPNNKQIFNEALESIENLVNALNNSMIPVGSDSNDNTVYAKVLISYRTDAVNERVNSIDWVVTELYFQIQIYENLIASSDVEIKIDTKKLDVGIINVVYDYTMSTESKIIGTTNVPTNYPAGAQMQLIIDVVPQTGTTVYAGLLNDEDADKVYAISYNNGIKTRTFNARLVGINENVVSGGTYGARITFLRTA